MLYNDRKTLFPKELDIYLQDYKIAIENNGMYWHSDDQYKHINKLKLCTDNNIRLLQFWDYQWLFKTDICKSIIKFDNFGWLLI